MGRLNDLAKAHRIAAKQTQTEYANRFGFESATAVSLWESGQRKVPPQVVEAMLLNEWIIPTAQYVICPSCEGRGLVATPPKEEN